MPEGDTIHTIAAAMAPRLEQVRLARIEFARRHGAAPAPGRVERVHAVGKHLLVELDGGRTLRVHLGMYGSWHRYRAGEPWRKPARRASVVLDTGEEVFVCFSAREVQVMRRSGIEASNLFHRLGPDLMGPDVDLTAVVQRARMFNSADTPLVDVLLDQRVACGIGNVYKCEILFLQRVHPATILSRVDDATLRRLYRSAAALLARNVSGGPRVTRVARDGRGRLWVYGRRGAPCLRCGDGVIQRAPVGQGARSTYWCPRCQAS